MNGFINNVAQTFNSTKDQVQGLLSSLAPGDVYMSFQTAEVIGKPVQTVADAYTRSKDKGWGKIAKELGIKPGSPEFHAMKNKMKGKKRNDLNPLL